MNFIAVNSKSKKIKKLALMLRDLDVNVYIYGKEGVGKTFLAEFIANNNYENNIIVEQFDELKSFEKYTKRIIATGKKVLNTNIKKTFEITIEIKLEELTKRKEDILEFINFFKLEAQKELKIPKIEDVFVDITSNLNSLKRAVYKAGLCVINDKQEMIDMLEKYFDDNYSDENSYNSELKIFDKALIKSVRKKYKSKLQMAKILKINRATLSKKVEQIENKFE